MDDKLKAAINSIIEIREFCMFECTKGFVYFLPDHYSNLDYKTSKRLKIGFGKIGKGQFYYLTDPLR